MEVIICSHCEKAFEKVQKNQKYCCRDCSTGATTKKALAKRPASKYRIFERDGFRCIYCGLSSVEDGIKLNADHLIPECLGGEATIHNLVTACKTCNSSKISYLPDEDTLARIQKEIARRNAATEARRLPESERKFEALIERTKAKNHL